MLATTWTRSGVLLTTVLALVVSGCGGGKTQSAQAPDGGSTADAPKAISIAIGAHQDTLDPTQFIARQMFGLGSQFGGTLTMRNRDGSKVTPGLAESWTRDGNRWTFKLRPNLKFSDGTPLTARDVAATFNYLKNRKDNTNGYSLATFKSARALNAQEVEMTTLRPSPRLDFITAISPNMIVPAAKIADPKAAKKFLADKPISDGPYMIESHSANKTVLVANPYWWGGKPVIQQETWTTNLDGAARLDEVRGGEVDFADDLPSQTAPQLTGDVHPSYALGSFTAQFLVMNLRKNYKTSSLQLRQAISAAIDRNQLSQIVYAGKVPPQLGVFPSTSELSDPFVSASANLAEAKDLVTKSGCKAPCSLKLIIPTSVPDYVQIAQLIAQQLGAAGIKVAVERLDDSVLFDHEDTGNFDLLLAPPYGLYDDDYVSYILPSDGSGVATWSGWKGADPYVKKWQTADHPEFKRILGQALARFHADMPAVPLVRVGYMAGSRLPDSLFSQSPMFEYQIVTRG